MIDNLPKSFRVGSVEYSVSLTSKIATECLWGKISFGNALIEIAEGLSEERLKNVLIHELTHAIFHEAGFIEHDEDMVNRVGNVLAQVLRDNDFGFMNELDSISLSPEVSEGD